MAKAKDKPSAVVEQVRPYVKRAMEDPDLRDDLVAAFVAARSLYGQLAKEEGVKGKAERVTDKRFQKELQELVDDLSEATERLKGDKDRSHKLRNRVILLTGVTLGVLYNPWTGPATRDWLMERIAGGDGNGFEEFTQAAESAGADTTSEPAE